MDNIKIDELLDSLTEDEFGAIGAVVKWLHDTSPTPVLLAKQFKELSKAITEHADKLLNNK